MHVIEKDFLFLNKNICCRYMCTQKNRPNELVLLSCQKPFFCRDFPKPNLRPNMHSQLKLEDLKVLRRSPDLLNNFKIGQGQLQLIMEQIWFYHIHFGQVT